MTETEQFVRKVLKETFVNKETNENVKRLKLETWDERYENLEIEQKYVCFGRVHYYVVSLWFIDDGIQVPLVSMSNIVHDPQDVILVIADAINRYLEDMEAG